MVNINKIPETTANGGLKNKRAGSIPPALKQQGHGRAYYTNGPLVAGASSLPAKPSSNMKEGKYER